MTDATQYAAVIGRKDNQIQIRINHSGKLYWSTWADVKSTDRHFLQDVDNGTITVDDPLMAKQRIYFILVLAEGSEFLFAEQTLPIEGMTNFRDYGGYVGANGKRVKWGLLYRSNHLHQLSLHAEHYIRQLQIKTVVDYRSAHEIAKSPNQSVGELKTYNLDPSAHTAELAAQFAAKPSDENLALIETIRSSVPPERINGEGIQVLEQYRNFVQSDKSKHAFKQLISLMLNPDNVPSIQHCRGGKDRTGYGVLLILTMLGVSKADIIQDYMLTKPNRLARNEYKMNEYRQLTDDENILGYLLSLIDTREIFIEEAFNMMEQEAGSAENYIKQVLGFTELDFQQMQTNYLQ